MTVSQYFTKIKVLWEELNSYRLISCNCAYSRLMQAFLQDEYVHCFLMRLDNFYAQIRGQILLMEPLPLINKILSLVVQEEKHRAIGAPSPPTQLAFLARNQHVPPQSGRGRGNVKKDRLSVLIVVFSVTQLTSASSFKAFHPTIIEAEVHPCIV
ncbi:uncharacterized protein DS421_10g302640 [Arachis hypogaea]|nr:uncharacterized protein DS421_10g302640 [Arachis hypogaea]